MFNIWYFTLETLEINPRDFYFEHQLTTFEAQVLMTYCRIQKVATYLNMVLFCTLFMVFLHPARVQAAASTKSCLYTLQALTTTNILPDSIESVTTSSRTECLARCVSVNSCIGVVYCSDYDVCYLMAATSDQGSVPNATCQMFVEGDAWTQVMSITHSITNFNDFNIQ